MNKKGVFAIKLFMFILASMIVSIIILLFFARAVPRIMMGSIEEVMAKDFGLAVMTLSASPYDITYAYDKNTERYSVLINQEEIKIASDEAAGRYYYLPMRGITVQNSLMSGVLSIPMSLKNKILTFSNENNDFADICSAIPMSFDEDNLDIKIIVDPQAQEQTKKDLNIIKSGIELRAFSANSNIRITENDQDITLILTASSSKDIVIEYYEDTDDVTTSWIHKIACYTEKIFLEKHDEAKNMKTSAFSEENTIKIDFGESLQKENTSLLSTELSAEIYQSITLGLMK
ncbi:MAG: hypothetical protein ACP5N2_06760 [Candidatus Nanoarchaeia archaeon]